MENPLLKSTIWNILSPVFGGHISSGASTLRVSVHLLNLRNRLVGLNQICTTYASPGVDTAPWVKRFQKEMYVIPLDRSVMV